MKAGESLRLVRGQREEVGGREDEREPAVSSCFIEEKKTKEREGGNHEKAGVGMQKPLCF